jgi:hypothetical protein
LAQSNKQLAVQPATITSRASVGNSVAVTPVLWRRYYGGPWVWYRPRIYRPYYGFGTYYYPYQTSPFKLAVQS